MKNLVLGTPGAPPAVIVPVFAGELAEILAQAAALPAGVDVVEWRVDHLNGHEDHERVRAAAREIAEALPGLPLLATVRTRPEGGRATMSDRDYVDLIATLAATEGVDMVDVEHARSRAVQAVTAAHAGGAAVVVSMHELGDTPSAAMMRARLRAMAEAGGDIVKLAVTPHEESDVLALLEATSRWRREAEVPAITMAMGRLGVVTRLVGHLFGSAATFAAVGRESAPGQPDLADLRGVLDAVARVTEG